MADETTQNGTASETSTAQDGQPSTPTTPATPDRVTELERQLQQIKSNQGRTEAELRRQLAAAQQQQRELTMRDMSEVERLTFERNEAINFARQAQVDADNVRLLQARTERISELARRTGVPFEELNKAESPDDLAILVHEYNSKLSKQQVKTQVDEALYDKEARKVDLGGGAPSTPTTRWERQIEEARKSRDPAAYIRLLRERPS